MRLIHCADLHIEANLRDFKNPEDRNARRIELLQNFPLLVKYAQKANADGILISGDLLGKSVVSSHTRDIILETISSNKSLTFWYVPGEHDDKNFLEGLSDPPSNLVIFDECLKTVEIGIFSTVTLTSLKITHNNVEDFYDGLSLPADRFNIVMLHGVDKSVADVPADTLYEDIDPHKLLDIQRLSGRHIDYLAMGGDHSSYRAMLDERCTVAYPGCLEGFSFNDTGDKGFILIDIDEESLSAVYSFINFSKRRYYTVNVDVSGVENTEQCYGLISEALSEMDFLETDHIEVHLTGEVDAFLKLDLHSLEASFAGTCSLFCIKNDTMPMITYSDYSGDTSVKGDFVRIVSESDLSDREKAIVIKNGIKALSGEYPL